MSDSRSEAAQAYRHLYNNKDWRERRAAQLNQHPLCAMCLEMGRTTAANTADHVIAHKGNEHLFWYGELRSLCASCHSSAAQAAERGRPRQAIGTDGWPIE